MSIFTMVCSIDISLELPTHCKVSQWLYFHKVRLCKCQESKLMHFSMLYFSECPPSHPFVFDKGKKCCVSNFDNYYTELSLVSQNCWQNEETDCPLKPCQDYSGSKAILL